METKHGAIKLIWLTEQQWCSHWIHVVDPLTVAGASHSAHGRRTLSLMLSTRQASADDRSTIN